MSFAPAVYPVPNRFINGGKESAPGSVAASTFTAPMTEFKWVDKYTRLEDNAWRNSLAHLYNLVGGVRIGEVSMGGPLFADTIGYPLLGIMGDYWQFVNGGVVGTSSSLSGTVAVGATSIVVSSGTGFVIGKAISVGAVGSLAEEVRTVTNISAGLAPGTLTLNAALYQGHASAGTVISYSSYTNIGHNFSLLGGGGAPLGGGGAVSSQPATYTYIDFFGLPAGTGARQFSFLSFSEVTLTGSAEGLVMWDAKATALASQITATQPSSNPSGVVPQPSWVGTMSINGAGTANNAEWKLTLTRKISPKFTNQGTQDPYYIPKGYFDAALAFTWDPASDEQEFQYYLSNSQPSAQIVSSNNLSGTNAASITITANQLGFDAAELDDSKDVFGYTESAKLIANTVNAGPSGGWSPLVVTLSNQVVNY